MRVALEPGDANNGRMVVTIEKPNRGGSEQVGETIYECRWNEDRRPIEEHKFCGRLKNDRPFYKSPTSSTDPDENPKGHT